MYGFKVVSCGHFCSAGDNLRKVLSKKQERVADTSLPCSPVEEVLSSNMMLLLQLLPLCCVYTFTVRLIFGCDLYELMMLDVATNSKRI